MEYTTTTTTIIIIIIIIHNATITVFFSPYEVQTGDLYNTYRGDPFELRKEEKIRLYYFVLQVYRANGNLFC